MIAKFVIKRIDSPKYYGGDKMVDTLEESVVFSDYMKAERLLMGNSYMFDEGVFEINKIFYNE